MSMWRWAEWFSEVPADAQVSLGEGETPLVRSRRIGRAVGLANLYFKLELCNPTGSYKDRFASAAVSDMVARGKSHCIATSSGNTGAALAAYCARSNMRCSIAIVEPAPEGKLKQMLAYGAQLFRVRGFGIDSAISDQTFETIRELGNAPDAAMQISAFCYSPAGMAGVQTLAYEIAEQAPQPVDHVFCPAGGGGLTLAVARGYRQLVEAGRVARSAAIECVQPAGNDTIASALRQGAENGQAVHCTTAISGLQVPNVVDGAAMIAACRECGGSGHLVDDDLVWQTQSRMAVEEGIFSEPAGVVSVAGALRAVAEGRIARDATVVCVITGSGFKDTPSLDRMISQRECPTINADQIAATVASR